MAANRTTAEKIELQREKMTQMDNEMKRLLRQEKEEKRKARTKRICNRGGLIESLLPDTIELSDERFRTLVEKTIASDFGRRTLATIKAEQDKEETVTDEGKTAQGGKVRRDSEASAEKATEAERNDTEAMKSTSALPSRTDSAAIAADPPEARQAD